MAGQIALWPRRTIIYCNSGPVRLKEREGEVVWCTLALICLPFHPTYHRQWWMVSGRMGTGGDIPATVRCRYDFGFIRFFCHLTTDSHCVSTYGFGALLKNTMARH